MFRRWIAKDPLLFWVTCAVVLIHVSGLAFLALRLPESPVKSDKNKKLLVKTMKLAPPKKKVVEEKIVAEAPPSKKNAPTPPPPKKTPPKPPPKKKNKPKAAPQKSKPKEKAKPVDDKRRKLLKQAQEALAKIDQRSDSVKASSTKSLKVPKRIEKLSFVGVKPSDSTESSAQQAYRTELASYLRAQLQLPDMGNVDIKVVVNSDGRVEKVMIISSENEDNADYITKTLPSLFLPPFGSTFNGAKSHTFHITLTNE